MWGMCQMSGGRYFGDETESATAARLKKLAAEARGVTGKATQLTTLEDFYRAKFGLEKLT